MSSARAIRKRSRRTLRSDSWGVSEPSLFVLPVDSVDSPGSGLSYE